MNRCYYPERDCRSMISLDGKLWCKNEFNCDSYLKTTNCGISENQDLINLFEYVNHISTSMCSQWDFDDKDKAEFGCGPSTGVNLYVNHLINVSDDDFNEEYLIKHVTSPTFRRRHMRLLHKAMNPKDEVVRLPQFISGLNSLSKIKADGFWIDSNEYKKKRRDNEVLYNKCIEYIQSRISSGEYIAFLNLDNAGIDNLVSCHWVTIIGYKDNKIIVFDNGFIKLIDFRYWYMNGVKRGALVSVT